MYLYGVFCCRQSGALLEAGVTQRSVGPCHPDAHCLEPHFHTALAGVIRSSCHSQRVCGVLVGVLTLLRHANWKRMTEIGPLLQAT